jgi:hypothetical protein
MVPVELPSFRDAFIGNWDSMSGFAAQQGLEAGGGMGAEHNEKNFLLARKITSSFSASQCES